MAEEEMKKGDILLKRSTIGRCKGDVCLGKVLAIEETQFKIKILYSTHFYCKKTKGNNCFQKTIKDLSEEQKCLHICGFQFNGYLENYKFCAEKCDRISERLNSPK